MSKSDLLLTPPRPRAATLGLSCSPGRVTRWRAALRCRKGAVRGAGRAGRAAAEGARRPGPAPADVPGRLPPRRRGLRVRPAGAFDLSQPTISHHLKVLHESGLLDREKRGVWVYYRARDPGPGQPRRPDRLPRRSPRLTRDCPCTAPGVIHCAGHLHRLSSINDEESRATRPRRRRDLCVLVQGAGRRDPGPARVAAGPPGEPMTVGADRRGRTRRAVHRVGPPQAARRGRVRARRRPRHRPAVPDQRQLRGMLPHRRGPGHGTPLTRPADRRALTRPRGGTMPPGHDPRS